MNVNRVRKWCYSIRENPPTEQRLYFVENEAVTSWVHVLNRVGGGYAQPSSYPIRRRERRHKISFLSICARRRASA